MKRCPICGARTCFLIMTIDGKKVYSCHTCGHKWEEEIKEEIEVVIEVTV